MGSYTKLLQIDPLFVSLKRGTYYVHPSVQATLVNFDNIPVPQDIIPTFVLSAVHGGLDTDSFESQIAQFKAADDVFSSDFLTNERRWNRLDSRTLEGVRFIKHRVTDTPVPNGPYFIKGDAMHQAWRLFPDHLDAFQSTCIPNPANKSRYDTLTALSRDGMWRSVAAPSRLYSEPSAQFPLAGKGISVKDNFELAGIKTALSNKAFFDTFDASNSTANFIDTLVKQGAIIVGKTKMCAFATAENPSDQWIDFHCPFNPRGDGYLKPGGSSTGGGAALAGYKWLDFSIGTDTTGSIRSPAAANGLFGLRPTWGAISTEGIIPNCPIYDTIGLLGRDLESFTDLANVLLPESYKEPIKFPKKILYPSEMFPLKNPDHQRVVDEFVSALEGFLGVEKTTFSLDDLWRSTRPEGSEGDTVNEFLGSAGSDPYRYDSWHGFAKFRADYQMKFNAEAYVGPYMQWFWDDGSKISAEQVEAARGKIAVYKQWFHDHVLKSDGESGSDAVLVLPFGDSEPSYRDTPNSVGGPVPAMTQWYMPPMLSIPHLVVPFGQLAYQSRVSKKTEFLPAVGTIAGAPGSDKMLVELAKRALLKAQKPTKVNTGATMFEAKI